MKFEREGLLSVLADASPALGRAAFVPALSHFWFNEKYLYAYDGGLGIRLACETDLACGIPGKPLIDLLKTSALKEVFIDVVKEQVVVQMGKSKVNLAMLELDAFFGKEDEKGLWRFPVNLPKKSSGSLVLSEATIEALTQVSFVRAEKASRPMHHGVTVVPEAKALSFYSTDSISIAHAVVEEPPPAKLKTFILPWAFIERILHLVEPGAVLHIIDSDDMRCLVAHTGDVRVYSNMLEPDEVDIPAALKQGLGLSPQKPVELPGPVRTVLERATIVAGKKDARITWAIKNGSLGMNGKYAMGSVGENLALKGKLREISGSFPSDLVARALPYADSFLLNERGLALYGGESFVYMLSSTIKEKS